MRVASRVTRWGVGLVVPALLVTGCASGADEETEVLGIQVERDGAGAATFAPTEEPTASTAPTATSRPAASVPSASPSVAPTDPTTAVATGTPSAPASTSAPAPTRSTPTPSRPSPATSPRPAASPTPDTQALTSREGHSYVTWFREEEPDGQGGSRFVWGEISAAPPLTRDGSEPLRTTVVDVRGTDDTTAPRLARCVGWVESDGDHAVRARGTVVTDLLVDGVVVATGRRAIDVTVAPGARQDVVTAGDVEVALPDDEQVRCTVRFVTG